MADIVKVIFQLQAQGEGVLDEINKIGEGYKKVNAEIKNQEKELKRLMEEEAKILAQRKKTQSPSEAAKYNEQLKKTKAAIDATKKSIDDLTKSEKDLTKESENLGKKIDNAFKGTQVKSLKAQLRDLKVQLADATDPKEIARLAAAAGELKDRLDDANEAAAVFAAGDKFEQIGNALGNVGAKLFALDFSGAADQSRLLVGVSKQLTFAEAIKGVKDLGTTFINLGRALLTNPIFLLATVIAGIIANFDALRNSGGLLGKVFTGIARIIDTIITAGKDLLDFLGIIDATAKSLEQLIDQQEQLIKEVENRYNREIALAKANQKATIQLENEKAQALKKSLLEELRLTQKNMQDKAVSYEDFVEARKKLIDIGIRFSQIETENEVKNTEIQVRAREKILDLRRSLLEAQDKAAEFNIEFKLKAGSEEQVKKAFALKKKELDRSAAEEKRQIAIDFVDYGNVKQLQALVDARVAVQKADLNRQANKQILDNNKELALQELAIAQDKEDKRAQIATQNNEAFKQNQEALLAIYEASITDETLLESQKLEKKLEINSQYYDKLIVEQQKSIDNQKALAAQEIAILETDIANRKKSGLDTSVQERELLTRKREINAEIKQSEAELAKYQIEKKQEVATATRAINEQILSEENALIDNRFERTDTQLQLQNARNSTRLQNELEFEKSRLELLKNSGKEYTEEYRDQLDKVALLEKEQNKQRIIENAQYFEQIVGAAISATNQILDAKIKEIDGQTSLQQKRVEEAQRLAENGNAELLQAEKERLDDLNKEREKYVRQQQALATVELVANTAIAVSKAAAEGGVAAGITIAAALLALVAGLASARSIAGQAAYYEGGYTGDGNPREVSNVMDGKRTSRPYTWHKGEFVMNHKKTAKYKDIFQGVHEGKIDLRQWQEKVRAFDSFNLAREKHLHSPVLQTNIEIDDLKNQMDVLIHAVQNQKTNVNIDSEGFAMHMKNIVSRSEYIRNNLAKG